VLGPPCDIENEFQFHNGRLGVGTISLKARCHPPL
jgi:hypothetical protein